MARPKVKEPKDVVVAFRVTLATYGFLRERAEDHGYDAVPAFCEAAAMATVPAAVRRQADPIERGPVLSFYERQVLEEQKAWGRNLNQLTRHYNTHPEQPRPEDLEPLLAMLRAHMERLLAHDP